MSKKRSFAIEWRLLRSLKDRSLKRRSMGREQEERGARAAEGYRKCAKSRARFRGLNPAMFFKNK